MRPLRLILRAFGPFPGEETVDFRNLGKRSFFLIHGQTGAGKSTLLDAISLALYGDDPCLLRKGSSFRSAHASPEQETEIVFDFELGEDRFRVRRVPQHERSKRRGEGITRVPASATLWRRTNCLDDDDEGEPIATQPKNVTARIEELIGFKCAQFRQVVLLPQGEFFNLLRANSSEREKILEQLFEVEIYQRVQDALKEEAQRIEQIGRQQRARLDEILTQAGVDSEDALSLKREQLSNQHEASLVRQRLASQAEDRARQALERGRADETKFAELRTAHTEYTKLVERKAEFENLRSAVEQARRALPLLAKEESLVQRITETKDADRHAAAQRAHLETAKRSVTHAKAIFEREQGRDGERKAAATHALRLTELGEKLERFAETTRKRNELEDQVVDQRSKTVNAQADWSATKERLEHTREQWGRTAEQASTLEAARQTEIGLYTKLAQLEELVRLRTARGILAAQGQELEHQVAKRNAQITAAREAERAAQQKRDAGRAGLLAASLEKGKPCPVCGSTSHPRPASPDHEIPDQTTLEKLRSTIDDLELALESDHERRDAFARQIASLEGQQQVLESTLANAAELGMGELQTQLDTARAAREQAEQALTRKAQLEAELTELEQRVRTSEATHLRLQKQLAECESKRDTLLGLYAEQATAIPEELRIPGAAQAAIATAITRKEELEKTFAQARELFATSREKCAELRASLNEAEENAKLLTQHLEQEQMRFDEQLEQAGFPSRECFREARRSEEEITALEARVREFETQFAAAKTRHERAEAATQRLSTPPLDELTERLASATRDRQQADAEVISLKKDFEHCTDLEKRLLEQDRTLEALRSRYKSLGRIAKVANGDNPRRLTFQRFVLAAFLDDVLDLASLTLRKLSKERYHLRRADESLDRRSAGGLDLLVFDAYTGAERSVSTLSGGESFLASLALALGLAEVVQHYAGGRRLDTIFIDEGFGTLDAEALDLAIATLLELREGKRMVGVISHVTELRERIDTRLEVVRGHHGSTTRFVLG